MSNGSQRSIETVEPHINQETEELSGKPTSGGSVERLARLSFFFFLIIKN